MFFGAAVVSNGNICTHTRRGRSDWGIDGGGGVARHVARGGGRHIDPEQRCFRRSPDRETLVRL